MNTCLNCDKLTNNLKYCSRSCSAIVNNRVPKRKAKISPCEVCGDQAKPKRKYCPSCFKNRVKDMTLEQATYGHLHKSSAFAKIRNRARLSVRGREQACQHCGYNKHVECCHVKPIASFSLSTLISVVNPPIIYFFYALIVTGSMITLKKSAALSS